MPATLLTVYKANQISTIVDDNAYTIFGEGL